jgi:probable HAF family extracellular repeat protein
MNSGYENAYLYSGGAMQSLGTLPGYTESQANAVNNDGQVVGVAYNGINDRAFIYSGDSMHDLGALGGDYSDAWGINDNGLVIGQAQTSGGNVDAFVYSDGVMQDLNNLIPFDPGWTLYEAYGINDEGLIVGEGFNPSGQQDAYLLTPVPEPSTRALLTAGAIIGLVGYGLRTRTVTRTAKPTALDQQDDSSILSSFPSHSSPVNVVRRAA